VVIWYMWVLTANEREKNMLLHAAISFSHYYSSLSWVPSGILLFTRKCYQKFFFLSLFSAVSYNINTKKKNLKKIWIKCLDVGLRVNASGAKICYQCDELHPSSKWKFWGEKITKCNGVPFEKFATKTSKAFGAALLTCYTVIFSF
jgi:hypothetical protein